MHSTTRGLWFLPPLKLPMFRSDEDVSLYSFAIIIVTESVEYWICEELILKYWWPATNIIYVKETSIRLPPKFVPRANWFSVKYYTWSSSRRDEYIETNSYSLAKSSYKR